MSIKRSGTLPFSRELLLDMGIVTPTPEEQAAIDRAAAEARLREAARAAKLAEAKRRLAEVATPVAHLVLDLHSEDEHGDCAGCDFTGYEAERPEWPCRTVEAVAAHYGIGLGMQP